MDGFEQPLDRLFNPRGIAVVGASAEPGSLGGQPLAALRANGFAGGLYPVNPTRSDILGLPAYPTIADVPGPVDLAVIAVRADRVSGVLEACGAAHIPFALVLTSGFAELGGAAAQLENEIVETARRNDVRLVGPNSLGVYNVGAGMPAGFGMGVAGRSVAPPGPAAIVSQSGGMAMALVSRGIAAGLGFSLIASTGNEADLDAIDFLEHVIEDPATRVVLAILEACRQAQRLPALAGRAAELGKPIVVAKMGRTESSRRASRSHTGSLTGIDRAFEAAFRQLGIIRADDLDEMVELAIFLLAGRLPRGPRVAVLTQSGGGGGWLAESLEREGLEVAETSPGVRAELAPIVPVFGATGNPIDVTASGTDAATFTRALRVLDHAAEFDSVALVLPLLEPSAASGDGLLASVTRATAKPVLGFSHWVPHPDLAQRLASLPVPYSLSPVRAARVLAAATRYAQRRAAPPRWPAVHVGVPPPLGPETWFPSLQAAGLPIVATWCCETLAEAQAAAAAAGGSVAMKVVAGGLLHKSDAGGVRLGVERALVADVFSDLMAIPGATAVLVQATVRGGVEVVVGARIDVDLGPLVMAGLGGIDVEEHDDVAIRLAPVDTAEAESMLDDLREGWRLRAGRQRAGADRRALAAVVSRLSACAVAWRDTVAEIDLNPVVVGVDGQGATIIDIAVVGRTNP